MQFGYVQIGKQSTLGQIIIIHGSGWKLGKMCSKLRLKTYLQKTDALIIWYVVQNQGSLKPRQEIDDGLRSFLLDVQLGRLCVLEGVVDGGVLSTDDSWVEVIKKSDQLLLGGMGNVNLPRVDAKLNDSATQMVHKKCIPRERHDVE